MLLIGYPKSGNTWISYLLAYCLNMPYDNLHEPGVHPREKWQRDLVSGNLPHLSHARRHGGVYSSHAPRHLEQRRDEDFTVYLVRDGRDVLVSYYYYLNRFVPSEKNGAFQPDKEARGAAEQNAEHFEEFVREKALEWKNHVEKCLGLEPQFLLKYEDMNADPVATLQDLFAAMDCEVTDRVIGDALQAFSFDRLSGRKRNTFIPSTAIANASATPPSPKRISGRLGR